MDRPTTPRRCRPETAAAPVWPRRLVVMGLALPALTGLWPVPTARAGLVAGHVHVEYKDTGHALALQVRVSLNWAGLVVKNVWLLNAGVPKSGQALVVTTPVPGGQFTTSAWVKNGRLTLKVTARPIGGTSISKTINTTAESTYGGTFTWTT